MNTMDSILVEGLEVETVIGVFDWERQIKQRLVIDLELSTDIRCAAETDDLQYTLDYKAISDAVVASAEQSNYQLIESLAESLAAMILNDFSVTAVTIKLSKPGAVPQAQNVAVKIHRSAD